MPQLQCAAGVPQTPAGADVPPLRPNGGIRCRRSAPSAAARSTTAASAPSVLRKNWRNFCPAPAFCGWTRLYRQKNAHETMLAQFARHEYDILLGTQMVAKGLDFEKLHLWGAGHRLAVVRAGLPRLRERVQPGHAGGGPRRPGHCPAARMIQTTVPDHPVLQLAAAQDYEAYYREGNHLP